MTSVSKNITNYRELNGVLESYEYIFEDVVTEGRLGNKYHWQIKVRVVNTDLDITDKKYFVMILDEWFDSAKMLPDNLAGYIVVDKWIENGAKHVVTPTIITEGKNKGKSNATNVFTQALSEAYSLRLKYISRNASDKQTDGVTLYPPMLANKYEVFDVSYKWQQPKFNGVRAVMTMVGDKVLIYSRQLKEYTQFGYLRKFAKRFITDGTELLKYRFPGKDIKLYIDGELYLHGVSLQDISGAARKKNSKQEVKLDYYCYDCFVPGLDLKYEDRKELLDMLFDDPEIYGNIKQVVTWDVTDEASIMLHHKWCLKNGYEGSMIRLNEPYVYSYKSYHSNVLLKLKPKLDEEFVISDFFAAERGKAKGCLMWVCEVVNKVTNEKIHFNVTPMGSLEERKEMYLYLCKVNPKTKKTNFEEKFKGKQLTIQFDEYSSDGVPVRANAVAIRDYE